MQSTIQNATPRADAANSAMIEKYMVLPLPCPMTDFARELERENNRLRELVKDARDVIEGPDRGEDSPGISSYERQFVEEIDSFLSNKT